MATDVNQDFIRPPLSAMGRFKCPVADRGETGKGVPLLSEGVVAACISDIKSQRFYKSNDFIKLENGDYIVRYPLAQKEVRKNEVLKLYNGIFLARHIKNDSFEAIVKIKRGGGKKGKIIEFSKKSRLNMIKNLAMMKNRPEFWFDLTYADDAMACLTHNERKIKSSEDLRRLKIWMGREGINIQGMWKREWKRRKSGILMGIAITHLHNFIWIENTDRSEYQLIYFRIAKKWLDITGTEGKYRDHAEKVIYHKNSFRFIESQKQMVKYASKYGTKDEEFIEEDGIGRSWGFYGDPIDKNPDEIEITNDEMILLKRMLRRFCKGINKKVKYGLNFCLSHQWTQFFVLIEKLTVVRMLEQIRSGTVVEGVPF